MATKSFISDTFIVNDDNASKFHNIINDKKKIKITKVQGHKKVKSKTEIGKLLNINLKNMRL